MCEVEIIDLQDDLRCTSSKDVSGITRTVSQASSASHPTFSSSCWLPGPQHSDPDRTESLSLEGQLKSSDWVSWAWLGSCLCPRTSCCNRHSVWPGRAWGTCPPLSLGLWFSSPPRFLSLEGWGRLQLQLLRSSREAGDDRCSEDVFDLIPGGSAGSLSRCGGEPAPC